MFFNGLFRKRLTINQGKQLLTEYCKENGFDDNNTFWKTTSYSRHFFAYHRRSNKKVADNWVSFHPIRGNDKYSIWIDLVSKEIREILR